MNSKHLAELSRLRIDQQTSKLALAERIEQQLLVTHNGGLFKSSPDLICLDRKSTRLNSSHSQQSRMPSSA